jgi:hypothetical protein
VTVEQAYEYASSWAPLLAARKQAAGGSLDKVEVLKGVGMVNASAVRRQPKVINGAPTFRRVLGERGRTRARRRHGSLPEVFRSRSKP